MTEEQKGKLELLKAMFLDGTISSSEYERRKEEIMKPKIESVAPILEPVEEIASPPEEEIVQNQSTKDGIVFITILVVVGLFAFISNYTKKSSTGYETKFDKLTPSQQDSVMREDVKKMKESARVDSINEAKRKKEEAVEEKAFLRTKAGKIWKKHPEWSKEDCERIADGRIWIGMHIDMLKYQNGRPNSATPSNYGNGTSWQWCWHDFTPSCYYDKNNDGLIDAYN